MKHSTKLQAKEAMFCEYYARIESATYGKKYDSAIAAGYSEGSASEMARRLCNNKAVSMEAIERIYEENARRHKGRILSHLEYNRLGAIKENDWNAANTALKLQAQILGFLSLDSAIGTGEKEQKQLSEVQEKEAKRLAKLLSEDSVKQGVNEQKLGGDILSDSLEQ